MSGKIKTGASTWTTASEMRVKTATTNWSTVSKAFVKTASGVWSQWFIAPIRDSFQRGPQSTLGSADTGQVWETLSGVWFADYQQGRSDTAASSYPLARINYGDTTATVSAVVTPGTGPAVWVDSSANWYAAVLYQDQVDGTYPCNCSCNGHVEYYSNPIGCPCGQNCNVCSSTSSTSTYGATATQTGTSWSYWYSAVASRYCTSAQVADPTNYNCYTTSYCYIGGGGNVCGYSCPSGGETGHPGNYSCYQANPIYTYSCPSGGTLSGQTCTVTTTTCNSCYSTACGICGYNNGSYFVSGGTYPNCDGYGSTCQQCGTLITRYFLRLIQSVNGNVTTPVADISLPVAAAAISINTTNDVLTYIAYSDAAKTAVIASGSYTPATPIKSVYHGIVKSPSAYGQGTAVDNFSVLG